MFSAQSINNVLQITDKGFTGHEHVDIIHMGGRIYDPTIGRFAQADPIIQAPENGQSLNRYSYVFNNPLSYTDPTGYFAETDCGGAATGGNATCRTTETNDKSETDKTHAKLVADKWRQRQAGNNKNARAISKKIKDYDNKISTGAFSPLITNESGTNVSGTPQTPVDNTSPFELGADFITGDGETNRYFGPGSEISKEFSEGDGAKTFEDFLFNKYDGNPQPGDEVTNFGYKFTWFWRAWTTNSAEHFMGSWKGTAKVMDDMVLFRAENTAGLHSLYFGRQIDEFNRQRGPDQFKLPSVPDIKTFNGKRIPFSNMNTIIEWTRELKQQKGSN